MTVATTKLPVVLMAISQDPPSSKIAPIKSWVPHELDDGTVEQAANLAKLPFIISHFALMPDAHHGYGMPIGGVLFADRAVVPYAIGVDIGCGVQIARTNLVWEDNFDTRKLKDVLRQIQRDIPTGFSTHKKEPLSMLDVERKIENKGVDITELMFANDKTNLSYWFEKAQVQLGTLGGGNHFLEVQRDEENRVYFMLHSGSRSLGKNICEHYNKVALELNQSWHSALPHKDLAYLPVGTDEHKGYWTAMNFALAWAELNREQMMDKVKYAFTRWASVHTFEVLTDVHHNYAAWENHKGKNGIVHRKGAVRARKGEMVLIPGSMGTNSYIATGLGNPESFQTCQHGAGRAHGRNAMMKMERAGQIDVFADMKARGIEFISNEPKTAAEEAPQAYKSIDDVMAASSDLIESVTKLWPLGVVKG